jgi:hypothetical protein
MRVLFLILNGLMAALFIFAAALQYNDDDIIRWMAIYLAAAGCCIAAHFGKLKPWVPVAVTVISVGWSVIYAMRGALGMPLGQMFATWEMKNEQIVEEREMFGLLIVAGWMIVLAVAARRRTKDSVPKA